MKLEQPKTNLLPDLTEVLTKPEWGYVMLAEKSQSSLFYVTKVNNNFLSYRTKYKHYWVHSNNIHDGYEEGMYRLACRVSKSSHSITRVKFFVTEGQPTRILLLGAENASSSSPYNYKQHGIITLDANLVSDHDWLSLIAGAPD